MYKPLENTWFVTATINSWQWLLSDSARIMIIVESLRYFCEKGHMKLFGFVIMPNHIHLLMSFHDDVSRNYFKKRFPIFTAQELIKLMVSIGAHDELDRHKATENTRKYHIWERRPRWIPVVNLPILTQKLDYIHNNPVRNHWALAESPEDYHWSSASFYTDGANPFPFLTNYI